MANPPIRATTATAIDAANPRLRPIHLRNSINIRDEICRQLGIEDGQTTDDMLFTLESVACLGACALAPVMTIGTEYHGQMTTEKVRQALAHYRNEAMAQAGN